MNHHSTDAPRDLLRRMFHAAIASARPARVFTLVITGPTLTNVHDFRAILIEANAAERT